MDGAGLVGDEEGGERRDDPGLAVAPGRDRRRGRLADRRGVAGGSPGSVIPAKAGIHASGVLGAFAGEATRLNGSRVSARDDGEGGVSAENSYEDVEERGPVALFTSPVGRGRRPQAGG